AGARMAAFAARNCGRTGGRSSKLAAAATRARAGGTFERRSNQERVLQEDQRRTLARGSVTLPGRLHARRIGHGEQNGNDGTHRYADPAELLRRRLGRSDRALVGQHLSVTAVLRRHLGKRIQWLALLGGRTAAG